MKYTQAWSIAENALTLTEVVKYYCRRFRYSFEAATRHVIVAASDQGSPQAASKDVAAELACIGELLKATRQLHSLHPVSQKILIKLQRVSPELSFAYADANLTQRVLDLAVGICCRITAEFDSFYSTRQLNLDAAAISAELRDDVLGLYLRLYLVAGLVEDVQSPIEAAAFWDYEDPQVYDGLPSISFAFQRSGDVVTSLCRLANAQLPDGPLEGFLWVKDGEPIQTQMMPTAWNFVKYLWDKPGKSVHAKVALHSNPGTSVENPDYTVGSWRRGANRFFAEHGIPWKVTSREQMYTLFRITDGTTSSLP